LECPWDRLDFVREGSGRLGVVDDDYLFPFRVFFFSRGGGEDERSVGSEVDGWDVGVCDEEGGGC